MTPTLEMYAAGARDTTPVVLIADPEVPTAQLLRSVFAHEGYDVIMVHDGTHIFDVIAERTPDVIILETRLGHRLSGFDVLRRLREDPATASIPTFLLTSTADWPDVLQGLELGADDTMRKPVHPRELLARAESKIKARRLEEALQQRTLDLEAILRVTEVLNQQHDWRALPPLLLRLLYEMLPLSGVALIVMRDGGKSDTIHVHPEPLRSDIKRWAQAHAVQLTNMTHTFDVYDSEASEANEPRHAVVFPLKYLDNPSEYASLAVFSNAQLEMPQVQLLEGIAKQANLALRNAELYRLQANYAQQLEVKVAERTRELQSAQSQLIQAEKLATVGRLAAGIAHEINNPLMPIKINLESILEDIQSGREIEEDMVTTTLDSVDRIRRLIQRLLEYNAGHATSRDAMQPLDVNEVAGAVQELTRKTFQQTQKTIILDLKPVPQVIANRDALTQVFINLALNAAEAMNPGGTLTISTRKAKDKVEISFMDTGHGIPPEMIDRVFDPFVTTKANGSGLGLFVSYGIIEGHHGTMKVNSTPDKGTTFTISLPVISAWGGD